MASIYVDSRAAGGGDGSEATPYQHPDDIQAGDISAGDSIIIVEGSGPYFWHGTDRLNLLKNGASGNEIDWMMNGCEFTCYKSASDFTWFPSSSGTNEYYLATSGGADPSITNVRSATVDNNYLTESADDTTHTFGVMGSLNDLQVDYGDNDSLGFSTLYLRDDAGFPVNRVVRFSQADELIDTNWGHHHFYDGIFSYGNISNIEQRGVNWNYYRCIFKYGQLNGINVNSASATTDIESCLFYWSGHRGVHVAADADVNVRNCTDWGAHLFLRVDSSVTSGGVVDVRNCVIANNEAAAFDIASSSVTFIEDYNHFHPRMTAAGGAIGYVSTANWATTGANDNPASTSTTTSNLSELNDPEFFSDPLDTDALTLSDLTPITSSPLADGGDQWWTGVNTDLRDLPFDNQQVSKGALLATAQKKNTYVGGIFSSLKKRKKKK